MITVTFDTLELVQRLINAGFTRQQAEEAIKVMRDAQAELATKKDVEKLDPLIKGLYVVSAFGAGWLAWLSNKLIAIAEKVL